MTLFCAWLAWSRFRVVLALLDKIAPSVFAALDVTLRRLGGAPTYVLTDNEKTVTIEHVAGMAVRNPATVAFARFYGVTVCTCEPADLASKGAIFVDEIASGLFIWNATLTTHRNSKSLFVNFSLNT